MPASDWIGSDGATTADRYRRMAAEFDGVSPSYRSISLGVASDDDVIGLLDALPAGKRQPNLLLAAVRFLDGPVGSWHAFREFVVTRWDDVAATMRARRTQTNEAARCATLLPLLATLPEPLALLEVGASAGLCLLPDRYRYEYPRLGADARAAELGTSGPVLHCVLDGEVPVPRRVPEVAWRAGLDLNPLDVTDGDDVRWLESLIWPEQRRRFETLRGALEVARADPPRVVRGDLTIDLAALRRPGTRRRHPRRVPHRGARLRAARGARPVPGRGVGARRRAAHGVARERGVRARRRRRRGCHPGHVRARP